MIVKLSFQAFNNKKYIFEVIIGEETFNRTTVKLWKQNTILNIEKSLIVGDEISGHFVYGHVDCATKILKINKMFNSTTRKIQYIF